MGGGCNLLKVGRWKVRVNSLWLWWYCALVLAGEAYLMYRAVSRCREYNELPWRGQQKPVTELYVYIVLIVVSVMCMPFLILTSIFHMGNYANDSTKLGRDKAEGPSRLAAAEDGEDTSKMTTSRLVMVWRHTGPIANTCHLTAALALLLPTFLLDSQEISHGIRPQGL